MALFITIIFALLYSRIILAQDVNDNGTENVLDIVKRQLNWNVNGYIVSSRGPTIKIDYLQPHYRNVEVLDNRNYMAFTLYMRNGQPEAPNTGIFHFIDSYIADQNRNKCSRKTMHDGAYYHFYSKCPENEKDMVASGYCYQGSNDRGLVYNSYTFNSPAMTYVDGQYYYGDPRVVNSYEQALIRACFNSWKSSGFKVNSWRCPTSGIPFASGLTSHSRKRFTRSTVECNDCECTPVNDSPRLSSLNMLIIVMSLHVSLEKY